ncbi:hypothetical protein GGI1_11813 [Acidithiobacillus sp. GGI-221]|nr:hypothetical protein GGI1_11813 [Acidithiobacillus sp. GGI-221]
MDTKLSANAVSNDIYNSLMASGHWTTDEAAGLQICLESALNLAFEKIKNAGINMEDIMALSEEAQRNAMKPMVNWVIRLITDQEVGRLLAEEAMIRLVFPQSTTLH